MSSQISLKVGSVTATLPVGSNITDAQVAAALTRYANSLGIPVNGSSQENLNAILVSIVEDIKERSKKVQISQGTESALTTLKQTVESENNL